MRSSAGQVFRRVPSIVVPPRLLLLPPRRLLLPASSRRGLTTSSSAAPAAQQGTDGRQQRGQEEKTGQVADQTIRKRRRRRRGQQPEFDGGPIREEGVAALPGGWADVREALKAKAESLGFSRARVTTPVPAERLEAYKDWIAEGKHGEMGYLARPDRIARREDLGLILPGVQAVVCTMTLYWPGKKGFPTPYAPAATAAAKGTVEGEKEEIKAARTRGVVSCYSWGRDYHDVITPRLAALAEWLHSAYGGTGRWYVDTGPLMERDLGSRAGLGFVGKNTLLINEKLGSGFFLAELLTTLPLPPDPPRKKTGGCGACRRCISACPTNAIAADGFSIDARRCISYLTIEHKGAIPLELRPLMGNLIYGCDICQQVCPWNRWSWPDNHPRTFLNPTTPPPLDVSAPLLRELLATLQTDEQFRARFADSPIQRIGRARLRRNVAVAMGNSGLRAEFVPVLGEVLQEEDDEMVREHVAWAIARLEGEKTKEEEEGVRL